MSIVWSPPDRPRPHDCGDQLRVMNQLGIGRVTGTIWQCGVCSRYWEWDGHWFPVRWFHFIARRRIAGLGRNR